MVPRGRPIALAALTAGLLLVPALGVAGAKTIGIVPPKDPSTNCDQQSLVSEQWTLTSIDRCRALEGVGPMVLPNNWRSLSAPQKLLTVIDLERVNRGLAPILGLSRKLDALAEQGAKADTDPGFSAAGFLVGGSIWAGAETVFEADYGWMYDDGYGAVAINVDCTTKHAAGCWGHRDNVLMDGVPPIVGGGAHVKGKQFGSYAFEMLAGYKRKPLKFTWRSELRHFTEPARVEPLKKPKIRSISPSSGPATGGTEVVIRGANLQSTTTVDFGTTPGAFLVCMTAHRCRVTAPGHKSGQVTVTAINQAGKSRAVDAATFTYHA